MLRGRRGTDKREDASPDAEDELPLHKNDRKKAKGGGVQNILLVLFIGCFVLVTFVFVYSSGSGSASDTADPLASAVPVEEKPTRDFDAFPLRTIHVIHMQDATMNGDYKESPTQTVSGHETYWSESKENFAYYCNNSKLVELHGRWAVSSGEEIDSIKAGHCASTVRAQQVTVRAEEVQDWEERDGEVWLRRGIAATSFRVVTMVGFQEAGDKWSGDFVERFEMIVYNRETYWNDNGESFLYRCGRPESPFFDRWLMAAIDKFEEVSGQCWGMVRSPFGRDLLDPATLKGWEYAAHEWEYLEEGGVEKLSWRTQSSNPVHKAYNIVPPPPPKVIRGADCGWCRDKIHGVFPSTIADGKENNCVWTFFPQRTIPKGDEDLDITADAHRAKARCLHLGHMCTGVICIDSTENCVARSGTELQESPNNYESALLPACVPKSIGTGECLREDVPEAVLTKPDWGDNEEIEGAALVVFSHGSVENLKRCLSSLLALNGIGLFHVYISLDPRYLSSMPEITETAEERGKASGVAIKFVPEVAYKSFGRNTHDEIDDNMLDAYFRKETFDKIFLQAGYKHSIFVEDHYVFAPDFLDVFRSAAWVMRTDSTAWCISATNHLAYRAKNECRMLQTSTFSGEGFMIANKIWRYIRKGWVEAMAVKWEQWLDLVFHRDGKVCLIPEVPRIHLAAPVTLEEKLRSELAFAAKSESTCSPQGPCNHFGDISYLLEKHYANTMHSAAKQLPIIHLTLDDEVEGGIENLKSDQEYLLPLTVEEYTIKVLKLVGHWPDKDDYDHIFHETFKGDRHGLMDGMLEGMSARLLIVDRRNGHHYLAKSLRMKMDKNVKLFASETGESCTEACKREETDGCESESFVYVNTCRSLESVFTCSKGCVPTAEFKFPSYDMRKTSATYQQCMVPSAVHLPTYDHCNVKAEGMSRLCTCLTHPVTTTPEETSYDRVKWMPKYVQQNNRDMLQIEAKKGSEKAYKKAMMTLPMEAINMKSVQDMRRYKKTHDPRDNPRRLDYRIAYNSFMNDELLFVQGYHDKPLSVDQAVNECEQDTNHKCRGFTCDRDEKVCFLKCGRVKPSKKGEVAYVKDFFQRDGMFNMEPPR